MNELQEAVLQGLRTVLVTGVERIANASRLRISCEGWLKLELLTALSIREAGNPPLDVRAELDNVDITVSRGPERCLVELKTFPTNYGGTGKPITNFIASVVADLEKLTVKAKPGNLGVVVWIAYPVPEPEPVQWPGHVKRVEAAAARTLLRDRVGFQDGTSASVYVMSCRKNGALDKS